MKRPGHHEPDKREPEMKTGRREPIAGESLIDKVAFESAFSKLEALEQKEPQIVTNVLASMFPQILGISKYMENVTLVNKWFERYYEDQGKRDHRFLNTGLKHNGQEPLSDLEFRSYIFQVALNRHVNEKQAKESN